MADIFLRSTCSIFCILFELDLKGGLSYPQQPGGLDGLAVTGTGLGIVDGICAGYGSQIDSIVGSLGAAKSAMNSPFSLTRNELNSLIGSATTSSNELSNGLSTISDAAFNSIPPLPDVSNIDNLLQNCGLLKNSLLSGISSPVGMVDSLIGQQEDILKNAMNNAINSLSNMIEAPIGFLINNINGLLKGLGIGDLLSQFDGLINCIEGICGRNFELENLPELDSNDFPTELEYLAAVDDRNSLLQVTRQPYIDYLDAQIAYVNNLILEMNLDDNGEFKLDSLLDTIPNISTDLVANITTISESIAETIEISETKLAEFSIAAEEAIELVLNPPAVIQKVQNTQSFFT